MLLTAKENPSWGYTHTRDRLYLLGHDIGRSTARRILLEHGLEPAPERGRTTCWERFLDLHLGAIAAADFFTVEVMTPRGLVRHWVLVAMDRAGGPASASDGCVIRYTHRGRESAALLMVADAIPESSSEPGLQSPRKSSQSCASRRTTQ